MDWESLKKTAKPMKAAAFAGTLCAWESGVTGPWVFVAILFVLTSQTLPKQLQQR